MLLEGAQVFLPEDIVPKKTASVYMLVILTSLFTLSITELSALNVVSPVSDGPDLFSLAEENSNTCKSILSDYQLAQLRAERARIEARNPQGELKAQESLINARIEYMEQLEEFYLDVLESSFAVVITGLEEEVAELQLRIADENLLQAKARFESGKIPRLELAEAEVAKRRAELELETSSWQRQDSMEDFVQTVEIEWSDKLLFGEPSVRSPSENVKEWKKRDSTIKRAELRLERKQLEEEHLPTNAPEFNLQLASAEVEQAQSALERAEAESERLFEQLNRRIYLENETRQLHEEELHMHRELLETAQRNHEQGLITTADLYQSRIQLVQAEIRAEQTRQNYLAATVKYTIGMEPGK